MWKSLISKTLVAAVLVTSVVVGAGPASADPYANWSCSKLWYARNSIYADFGYCFETKKAINVFGYVCHPPYGKLPKWAQKKVNKIKYWENVKGC